METSNPDTRNVAGQGDETHRGQETKGAVVKTIFGAHVSDSDELSRPPEDRSPLTFLSKKK